jgi:hypothetical protein
MNDADRQELIAAQLKATEKRLQAIASEASKTWDDMVDIMEAMQAAKEFRAAGLEYHASRMRA